MRSNIKPLVSMAVAVLLTSIMFATAIHAADKNQSKNQSKSTANPQVNSPTGSSKKQKIAPVGKSGNCMSTDGEASCECGGKKCVAGAGSCSCM